MKKRRKVIYIPIFLLFGIIILFFLFSPIKEYSSDTYQNHNRNVIGEIKSGDIVVQKFKALKNYKKIGFPIAVYDKIFENGTILVQIEEEGKKAKTKKIPLKNIEDNEYYYVKYKFHKNKNYTITITTKGTKLPITLYTTDAKIKNTSLFVNEKKQKSCIQLSFLYQKNNYFPIWYILLILSIIICCMLFSENKKEEHHEK